MYSTYKYTQMVLTYCYIWFEGPSPLKYGTLCILKLHYARSSRSSAQTMMIFPFINHLLNIGLRALHDLKILTFFAVAPQVS